MSDEYLRQMRKAYRELRSRLVHYTFQRATDIDKAVAAMLPEDPRPKDWVRAIKAVLVRCGRCAGTGRFITRVENGKPQGPGGICFRCQGNGAQDIEDTYRNEAADRYAAARAC